MNRKCARTVFTHAEAIGGSEIESVSATNDWDFWLKKKTERKYRTKRFPFGIAFITNILEHS